MKCQLGGDHRVWYISKSTTLDQFMKDVAKRFGRVLTVESYMDGSGYHWPGNRLPMDLTPLLRQEPQEAYHLRVWLVDSKMQPSWRNDECVLGNKVLIWVRPSVFKRTPPGTPNSGTSPIASMLAVEGSEDSKVDRYNKNSNSKITTHKILSKNSTTKRHN